LVLAPEIRIPVLAVFGGADPSIPPDQIAAFERALRSDKEVVTYPGAPHGFLRYGAGDHKGAIADALARTYEFLGRVLAS
jgi:carboxymethylenebutenolidase